MTKSEWNAASKSLISLINEWDKIILRPYKDICALEKDLRMSLILKHYVEEQEWIKTHS